MAEYSPPNPARSKIPKPPVLHQGAGHGTAAMRTMLGVAHGGAGATTRHRKAKGKKKRVSAAPRKARKARVSAARSGKAHLVKGSAAAKKRMAALRGMRGKKAAA